MEDDAGLQGIRVLPDDEPCARKAYAVFVARGMSERELVFIRQAIQRCQLTGSSRFIDEVEERFGHRLEFRGQGRPAKNVKVVE